VIFYENLGFSLLTCRLCIFTVGLVCQHQNYYLKPDAFTQESDQQLFSQTLDISITVKTTVYLYCDRINTDLLACKSKNMTF